MSDASTPPTTQKKFCLACANNKKDGIITPTLDGRCPVCSSDSLLSIDALTRFLGSKTNEQNLSVQEENALISDLSSDSLMYSTERRPASKPVRPNMVLHEVLFKQKKATMRCVRFATSAEEATKQAVKDPSQPWYLHEGDLSETLLESKAVNRNYSDPLKDSK